MGGVYASGSLKVRYESAFNKIVLKLDGVVKQRSNARAGAVPHLMVLIK